MKDRRKILMLAGVLSFAVALFQAIISFSPSVSLYLGAPEFLAANTCLLVFVGLVFSGIIAVFGLYALSGAGHIRKLPWLRPMLATISAVYTLRGLLLVPELLILFGVIHADMPVAPRFIVFSMGSLLIGLIYITGTIAGWRTFSAMEKGLYT